MPDLGAQLGATVAAALGSVVGLLADRLAARWPAHEDGAIRRPDWRTVAIIVLAALAFGGLAVRWSAPRDLVILGLWFGALIVLLATDLDQRLLPDWITLPLIPISLVLLLSGWSPVLGSGPGAVVAGLVAGLGLTAVLAVTDVLFHGGLGMGDLKLSLSLGFMVGVTHLVAGLAVAAVVGAAVLLILLAGRRITLRSFIPFGPILIVGGILAALAS